MTGSFFQRSPREVAKRSLYQPSQKPKPNRRSRRKRKGPPISMAGHTFYLDELDHTAFIAPSGGGKNLIATPTLCSLVEAAVADPTRRLKIIDTKGEITQKLQGMGAPYHLVTLSSFNGLSQNLSKDCNDYTHVVPLCTNLIPPMEGNNAYFRNAARALLIAGIASMHEITGGAWGIDDVVNFAFEELDVIKAILSRTDLGQRIINTLLVKGDNETLYKVRTELASWIWPLMVTAGKYQVSDSISLIDFWEGKTDAPILVVKLSADRLDAELPMVSAMLQRSFEHIMGLTPPLEADRLRKDKIVFIDDMNFYRRIPKFLEAMELIRGCGGLVFALIQSVEGLRTKASYGDEADGLLANFANIIMLRSFSPVTAKWFSSLFGQTQRVTEAWGTSYGKEGSQGRADERRAVENLVPDRAFLNMKGPSPENGVTCYLKTQEFGEEMEKVIPWEQIIGRHPPSARVDFSPLPKEFQVPAPWSDERREFLCHGKKVSVASTAQDQGGLGDSLRDFDEEIRRMVFDLGFEAIERLINLKSKEGK